MSELARRRPLVLIVDDDPDFRGMLREVVADEGLLALEAGDGQEALDILSRARPGLITLDLDMPRLDGRQFLRALKGAHSTPLVHVFVISSHPPGRARLPAHSTDLHLQKPLCIAEFVGALRAVFHDGLEAAPPDVEPPEADDFDA